LPSDLTFAELRGLIRANVHECPAVVESGDFQLGLSTMKYSQIVREFSEA
jgi:hypothetical protein